MGAHSSLKTPRIKRKKSRSHPGQAIASEKKKQRKEMKAQALAAQAKRSGVTVVALQKKEHEEFVQASRSFKRDETEFLPARRSYGWW